MLAMTAPVSPGELLAGKYVVDRILGEGGMGIVVSATHQQLGQRVAVKFLLPAYCENPEAVARFLREAQAAVRIQSEHVARVIDVGTLESGAPYMVMEYLSGRDLASELTTRGPLPIEEAVGHVLQACEAIAEAHAHGIVHRDLKPANLFLARRADGSPLVKVLDFGISKSAAGVGAPMNLTSTQSVMGSPLYMSPEQLKSTKNVDHRTDIWALGVILYELVTGVTPFRAETVSALIATVVSEQPPALRTLRPEAPPELEAILSRCLEKDPARRVPHVGTLALALEPLAPGQGAISVPRIKGVLESAGVTTNPNLGSLVPAAAQTQTAAAFGQDSRPRERGPRRLWLLGAVVAVGALATGGTLVAVQLARAPAAAALASESVLGPPISSAAPDDSAVAAASPTHTPSASAAPESLAAPPDDSVASPARGDAATVASAPPRDTEKPAASATGGRPRATATVAPPRPAPVPRPRRDPLDGRR
jgi:tRNA A-37 threonylcarbamoyl transferase component Bud32